MLLPLDSSGRRPHSTPAADGAGPPRCRYVLSYRPRRVTSAGITHQGAVACGDPVAAPGGSWCASHRAALFEPARTPELCEELT